MAGPMIALGYTEIFNWLCADPTNVLFRRFFFCDLGGRDDSRGDGLNSGLAIPFRAVVVSSASFIRPARIFARLRRSSLSGSRGGHGRESAMDNGGKKARVSH